jgi:hypothetical protein
MSGHWKFYVTVECDNADDAVEVSHMLTATLHTHGRHVYAPLGMELVGYIHQGRLLRIEDMPWDVPLREVIATQADAEDRSVKGRTLD